MSGPGSVIEITGLVTNTELHLGFRDHLKSCHSLICNLLDNLIFVVVKINTFKENRTFYNTLFIPLIY